MSSVTQNYTMEVFRSRNTDDDGWLYVARHPELPGCFAQGETVSEAKANLVEAKALYMDHRTEHGLPMPLASAWSGGAVEWEVSE